MMPRSPQIQLLPALLLLLLFPGACDRSRPATAPTSGPASEAGEAPTTPRYRAEFASIAPLAPRQATHVAVDSRGNVYCIQSAGRGDDVMFVIGSSDVPHATQLSIGTIVAALRADPAAKGEVQSIAAGPDGEIYFYFTGGTRRETIAAFGVYLPRSSEVRILANTEQLERASAMGASLSLARGSVVVVSSGRAAVYLWLRHSDDASVFALPLPLIGTLQMGGGAGGAGIGGTPASLELSRPFTRLRYTDKDGHPQSFALTREEYSLSAGPRGSLLLVDRWSGALWRIDPGTGDATVLQSLVGLPHALSDPGVNDRGDGTIALFAADSDPIPARVADRVDPVDLPIHYPALLQLPGTGQWNAVPREDLRGFSDFPVYAAQLAQLVYEPPPRDSWVGYDSTSGQLLRIKLVPKE